MPGPKPLPLPGDLQYIRLDVIKIIDELHIKNHVDPRCQQYHPNIMRETILDMNTKACGQTFVWISWYKKILSVMPKTCKCKWSKGYILSMVATWWIVSRARRMTSAALDYKED